MMPAKLLLAACLVVVQINSKHVAHTAGFPPYMCAAAAASTSIILVQSLQGPAPSLMMPAKLLLAACLLVVLSLAAADSVPIQ
jgi:hypothetical protein